MKAISHGKNIVREVNMAHQSGMMFSIIDSRMGSYPSECVERFADLALRCCQDKPEDRPSMLDVVRELENILRLMPETGTTSSKSAPTDSGTSASHVTSDVSGSNPSGVISEITPR